MIGRLPTREHVRYFRQDSWQWDYLHAGRCTTSQCPSALGFLEVRFGVTGCLSRQRALREISSHDLSYCSQPKAADFLRIPKSLQRGGTGAWDRLWQAPGGNQSLGELEAALCKRRPAPNHDHDDDDDDERM